MSNLGLNTAPFPIEGRRTLLLADGAFSTFGSKTAVCYIRYRERDVVAVLDGSQKGKRVGELIGFGGDIPVVGSVSESLERRPEVAIVGTAPVGGQLDPRNREQILQCIDARMDVVGGLHALLEDDAEIAAAAKRTGSRLWDARKVPETFRVGSGRGCTTGARTVLTVGTDCNVGKMTVTVELFEAAVRRGINASWAATGQTGIMLRGRGIAVDRVVADFVGGSAEELVNFEGRGADVVFVEGQGSLIHPGYGGVTLGLLFGVMPDCMVMAHAPTRTTVGESKVVMPPIGLMIKLYESTMAPLKKSPVVAVALNTHGMDSVSASEAVSAVVEETGLPACDLLRTDPQPILDAVLDYVLREVPRNGEVR